MTIKFKVDEIFGINCRGKWISVIPLEPVKDIFIGEYCTLGGVSITNNWDFPRQIDTDLKSFVFQLKNSEDSSKFSIGQEVDLFCEDHIQQKIASMNKSTMKDQ